jgi:cell envelope-related function transcriptional attenuator common domain
MPFFGRGTITLIFKKSKVRRFNIKIYLITTLIFILSGSLIVAAAIYVKHGVDFIEKPQFEDSSEVNSKNLLDNEELTGKLNFLFVGTDLDGVHSDTIMVASYNLDDKKMNIISIPRDTRVLIKGKYRKINAAYAIGGMDLLLKTLSDTFGIGINYYTEINYEGFVKAIDVLGGVDFDVPRDMNYDDPVQNLHIHLKKGMQHLDGKGAEGLVRWRHNNNYTSGYALGDVGREGTQQLFIKALMKQKLTTANLLKIGKIYGILSQYLKSNLAIKDCLALAPNLKKLSMDNLKTYQLPGDGEYVDGISYFLYDDVETTQILSEDMDMDNIEVIPCKKDQ